jgi:hypothetical protein
LDCKKGFFLQILCLSKQKGNLAGGNGKRPDESLAAFLYRFQIEIHGSRIVVFILFGKEFELVFLVKW